MPKPLPSLPDEEISKQACAYVKKHKDEIVRKFAGPKFPAVEKPISIFMAGSPGAGKTEFSKSLIQTIQKQEKSDIIRIDGDEIRQFLPGYIGSNSYLFQRAISMGVTHIYNETLAKNKSFILDGTFSNLQQARINVTRSLKRGRRIIIIYIYQDPLISWRFTQKREKAEGRRIEKTVFINKFFTSKEVVQKIKNEFKEQVVVWLLKRNLETKEFRLIKNIENIDDDLDMNYSIKELNQMISV